jgi:hypothetical protein
LKIHWTALHIDVYTPKTLTKEGSGESLISLVFLLVFQQKMKNWISRHSTGFLSYICVIKQRYIVGSANYSTKPLPKLFAVWTWLYDFCDISCSRGAVSQMWILKNSEEMLGYMESDSFWRILKKCWGIWNQTRSKNSKEMLGYMESDSF